MVKLRPLLLVRRHPFTLGLFTLGLFLFSIVESSHHPLTASSDVLKAKYVDVYGSWSFGWSTSDERLSNVTRAGQVGLPVVEEDDGVFRLVPPYLSAEYDPDTDPDTPNPPPPSATTNTNPSTPTTLPLSPTFKHVPGFTVYDRLYLWNGTFYAVAEIKDWGKFPERRMVLSKKGLDKKPGVDLDPGDAELQLITPKQARLILGTSAILLEGPTWLLYDTRQFMSHYYHWWGEIMLGIMRVYSSLALVPGGGVGGKTALPEPARILLPNVPHHKWHDSAHLNAPLLRAAFPSTSVDSQDAFEDMRDTDGVWVFERAVVVSRVAAHQSPLCKKWAKMISSTMAITPPTRFWEPVRERVVKSLVGWVPLAWPASVSSRSSFHRHHGLDVDDENHVDVDENPHAASEDSISHTNTNTKTPSSTNLSPKLDAQGNPLPLVLYITRQHRPLHGRKLSPASASSLARALEELEREGVAEVVTATMEGREWGLGRQVGVVGRATIMLGIHGNGLTHQLWMPPSERSTVIEIFYPNTYLHDYSMLARNLGHKHYAIWNDTALTFADPLKEWFEGVREGIRDEFHGDAIPVHAPTVVRVVRERLGVLSSRTVEEE